MALDVREGTPGASLALRDEGGVEGLPQRAGDGGRKPVPEEIVLADYRGFRPVPVAIDPVSSTGRAVDEVVACPVAVVSVVVVISVSHDGPSLLFL